MIFKKSLIPLLTRVVIIFALSVLSVYFFLIAGLHFTGVITTILLLASVYNLWHYVSGTQRELQHFLDTVRFHDFSGRYAQKSGKFAQDGLKSAYNLILEEFSNIKATREFHAVLLQTIVDNIPVGIICTDQQGKVIIYNREARKQLGAEHLIDTRHLKKLFPELSDSIEQSEPGKPLRLKLGKNNREMDISVKSIPFELNSGLNRLVTLIDIHQEMEMQEIESWQKIIRILSHEIVNSVTPIYSLSGTLSTELNAEKNEQHLTRAEVKQGLLSIHNRSAGLLHFVEHFRNLARIPQPDFRELNLSKLIHDTCWLLREMLSKNGVIVQIDVDEKPSIWADASQIEQVLINLIKNAAEAMVTSSVRQLSFSSGTNNNQIWLSVHDTGTGITPENLSKIFIPFFTSKPDGNGIGLSLSRQILLMNKATIMARSETGKGTTFTINFLRAPEK